MVLCKRKSILKGSIVDIFWIYCCIVVSKPFRWRNLWWTFWHILFITPNTKTTYEFKNKPGSFHVFISIIIFINYLFNNIIRRYIRISSSIFFSSCMLWIKITSQHELKFYRLHHIHETIQLIITFSMKILYILFLQLYQWNVFFLIQGILSVKVL